MIIAQAANDWGQPARVAQTDPSMRLAAPGGRGAPLQADENGGFNLHSRPTPSLPRRSRRRPGGNWRSKAAARSQWAAVSGIARLPAREEPVSLSDFGTTLNVV